MKVMIFQFGNDVVVNKYQGKLNTTYQHNSAYLSFQVTLATKTSPQHSSYIRIQIPKVLQPYVQYKRRYSNKPNRKLIFTLALCLSECYDQISNPLCTENCTKRSSQATNFPFRWRGKHQRGPL